MNNPTPRGIAPNPQHSATTTQWIADAVKRVIEDAGMTKTSLSEKTGIPYPTLNRKLNGHAEFRFSELIILAEALHVAPNRFTPPAFQAVAA